MSEQWCLRLPPDKAMSAVALRLRPGISICTTADAIWLRGEEMTDELNLALRKLPGGRRFMVDACGALTPEGARLATLKLPDGPWEFLQTWLNPAPQVASIASRPARRITLGLARADHESPATVLVTSLAQWKAYADSAPLVRLRRLRFAAASDGRVLLRGEPLPPLAGQRYVESEGVAVPCGFVLCPTLDPATARALLATTPDDLALFDAEGQWELIKGEEFVHATRASARATAEGASQRVGIGHDDVI